MKKSISIITVAAVGIWMAGCYTPQGQPDRTATGVLAGGATGAAIGGIAGHGSGAVIGGALGALVGGLIGHGMDQEQELKLKQQAPQTYQRVERGQPLTVSDVEALTQSGINDDLIISQIRNSRTVYHLTTGDIIALKNAGVSDRVINFMINTPSQVGNANTGGVVGPAPPPPHPQNMSPAPGPGYVWVPGAWLWSQEHWVWRPGYWYRPSRPRG